MELIILWYREGNRDTGIEAAKKPTNGTHNCRLELENFKRKC